MYEIDDVYFHIVDSVVGREIEVLSYIIILFVLLCEVEVLLESFHDRPLGLAHVL